MPRLPRLLGPDQTYHVHTRGNNRATVFWDDHDRDAYLGIVAEAKSAFPCRLFHFTLMSNHVHLLVHAEKIEVLPAFMKVINERYAMRYRRRHGGVGHLWTERYKSHLVSDDSYLLTCGAYIELNPVRAGMVFSPEDYRWSSYRHYALGERHALVDDSVVYETLGGTAAERRREYRRIVRGWMAVK